MTGNKLSSKIKIGYGIGTLSYGIPFQLVSACFVFYSTMVLGISGALTGLLVSASTIWDAVTDPVMGYISDHTNSKILLGRRLFYVLIGALGLAFCTMLLWHVNPTLPYATKAVLLGLLLILLKTFSTIYTTPYMALGAELSSDYSERTAVQSYRTAFFFLGFMFPTILGMAVFFRPTPEYKNGQLNPEAYTSLALVTAAITLVSAAVCIAMTFRHQPSCSTPPVKKKNAIIGIFKESAEALKCSDFRNVSIGLLFVNMAMSIVGSIGMHIFTYTFGLRSGQIAIVFGSLFAMALLAQPAWLYIANKFEKKTALKACLIINIGVTVLFFIFVFANAWVSAHFIAIVPLAMLTGFSMGGSIALPYSMITDTIDKDAYYSGTRKEGVFYGCATFMFKLSQSLAAVFAGTMLDIVGFKKGVDITPLKAQVELIKTQIAHIAAGQDGSQLEQFNAKLTQISSQLNHESVVYLKLGLILPVGFLISFVLALVFVNKYTLNKEKVAVFQSGINGCPPQ